MVDPTNAAMGSRIRDLRIQRGLQQGEAARRLGISPAYLSLLETGKRTVQLPILWRALELYGQSMEGFMASLGEGRVDESLERLLDEPLLRSLNLTDDDLRSFGSEPKVTTTITALFNLYKNTRQHLDNLMVEIDRVRGRASGELGPVDEEHDTLRFDYHPFDEVTDFLEDHHNFFASLEERAEEFRRDVKFGDRVSREDLVQALQTHLDVRFETLDERAGQSVIRRWDEKTRTLSLSSQLSEQRTKFQLAQTIGQRLFDEEDLHDSILEGYEPQHRETRTLIKIHLANYFAGAVLLPYQGFYEAVRRTRYDVELLARLFGSSYESVAHRMCNLGDPKRRGMPMHFWRVDVAGNISKRYSGDGIRFSHHDGSCPKMSAHLAFLSPHVLQRQYSAYPDGTTYFCFARVVTEPRAGSLARGAAYSIGLGCHAEDAKHFAYADDMPFVDQRMAVPVGTTCRFCERTDCNMRSSPSYKYAFRVDEHLKKDNFFSPVISEDDVVKRRRRRKRNDASKGGSE